MSQRKVLPRPLVKEMMISGHQESICLKEVADLTGKEPSTLQSIVKKWKDTRCEKTSSTKGVQATRDADKLKPILLETAFFSFLDFLIALLVYLIFFACLYKVAFPKYFAFLAKKVLK